jgi:hypothetical protein
MSSRGRDLDRLAELEQERDFLLASLEDLEREHDAGDVDDHDYQALRDGYTARAAAVLRDLAASEEAVLTPRRPLRWGRVGAIAATMLALGALAGWLVAHYSGQNVPSNNAVTSTNDKVAQLLAGARQVAPIDALNVYGQVLALDPGNVEALTYSGWSARILAIQQAAGPARTGLIQAAQAKLAQAVAADPSYPDAQCFMAVLTFRDLGQAAAAKPYLDRCEAANPPAEVKGLISAMATDLDKALAGAPATTEAVTPSS